MRHKQIWRKAACAAALIVMLSQISACGKSEEQPAATALTNAAADMTAESPAESKETAAPSGKDTGTETWESTASGDAQTESSGQEELPSETDTKAEEDSTTTEEKETETTKALQETTIPEDIKKPTEPSDAHAATGSPVETTSETTSIQPVEIPTTMAGKYTGTISVKGNSAPGTEAYSGNGATIDASNKASGYIMAKYEGASPEKRVKVRVSLNNVNYDYDLNTNGSYEAFPLQMGNGSYTVIVMQNVVDNQYAVLHSQTVQVELSNALNPYLYPSQRANYNASMEAVKTSYDLCVGLTTDEQKAKAIYDYVTATVAYDYDKAAQVTSGTLTTYVSKADTTLSTKKGICLDYATLMAVMLRAQNIPTQIICGTEASASYHAWNQVYYNGGWVLYDATYGAGGATGSGYTETKRY